jgi:hypothetical protein
MERLGEAAALQELIDPKSLLLVAIDAPDNAVSAGKACKPPREFHQFDHQPWRTLGVVPIPEPLRGQGR